MPPDPARVAETRAWLVKAESELRAAHVALGAEPPLLGHAAFHARQAAAVDRSLERLGGRRWARRPPSPP